MFCKRLNGKSQITFLLLLLWSGYVAQADIITFPLTELIGPVGRHPNRDIVHFDLGITFSEIQSVTIQCSGSISPGIGCGDGVERPVFPYYEIPGTIEMFMDHPATGSCITTIGPYDGSFSVEQFFECTYDANWDILLDGQEELVSHITSYQIVIGGATLEYPTATISEAYLIVEGIRSEPVYYVDDDGPGDPGPNDPNISDPLENGSQTHPFDVIQEAHDAASHNDTVLVLPGVYKGSGNRDLNIWKGITVKSIDGPKSCIIDCEGSAENPHGGFSIGREFPSTGPDATLEGFTIKNGYSESAYSPSGIFIFGGNPTIRKCIISQNTTTANQSGGGGIRCMYTHPNPAPHPQIIDCEISHNRSDFYGGGIYIDYGCNADIMGCLFHHNYAGSLGGAIAAEENAMIQSSTITDNITDGQYSGIFGRGTVEIWYSICWNNDWNTWAAVYFKYSDVQGNTQATNFDEDPFFADPANDDYHLKSQAGRWNPQIQKWVYDSTTSPCIDRGKSSENWTAELWPHGKRKNLGAYGGTPEASMSLSPEGNPADLNHDNKVNFTDFYLWSVRWFKQQNFLHEDFNRNGIVDLPDAYIFCENWLWSE